MDMHENDCRKTKAVGTDDDVPRWVIDPEDVRGLAQLASEATLETTRLVEAVHAGVLDKVLPGSKHKGGRAGGLTGWIYRTIRQVMRLFGRGATRTIEGVERAGRATGWAEEGETVARDRMVSVLNGIVGDHLAATGNPLARSFSLRTLGGQPVTEATELAETVVVFVHGLCCSDRDWRRKVSKSGHVSALAGVVGGLPVFARYNTGTAIRENGQHLSRHLDALMSRTNGPNRIVLVTHSMGGLVARSAFQHAAETSARWTESVTETIYLGTPHLGAPLERAGVWVEEQLRQTLFTMPLANVGAIRSRGIKDLRDGVAALRDPLPDDKDHRLAVAPPDSRILYIGSTIAGSSPIWHSVGDGLVPLDSALNAPDTTPATRKVFERVGHMKLIRAPTVTDVITRFVRG